MQYTPSGVCSKLIEFDLDSNNCVHDVHFTGGCNGNLKGIASLVEGMNAEEAVRRLSGITCGMKGTSCPDQLACAIKSAMHA